MAPLSRDECKVLVNAQQAGQEGCMPNVTCELLPSAPAENRVQKCLEFMTISRFAVEGELMVPLPMSKLE